MLRRSRSVQALSFALLLLAGAGCATADEPAPVEPDQVRDVPEEPEESEPLAPAERTADPAFQDLRQREMAARQRRGVLVDHQMKLGQGFIESGRLEDALKAYAAALELDPTHKEARRRYALVAGLLGRDPQAMRESETRTAWTTVHARLQQLTFLAREHFRRGHHFKSEGMYDDALREYRNAQLILEVNPQVDADYDALRIKAAIASCEREKEGAARRAEAKKIREVDALLREEDRRERQRIESRVLRLWQQANALYERGDYDGCERLCAKILDLDPHGWVLRKRR